MATNPTATSAGLSILLAVVGYVSTALHTLRAQQHKGRVDRVGEQLKEFYGPLLACVTTSKSSYDAMLRHAAESLQGGDVMTPAQFRVAAQADAKGSVAQCYRTWVREVLLPLSDKASRLVVQRADLLEGSSIEPLLLQLVAHASALRVLVRRWDQGDGEDSSCGIAYPDELRTWAEAAFVRLKRRQSELLGISSDGGQGSPLMRVLTSKL